MLLTDVEDHDSHEREINEDRGGATLVEGTSGTDEEASTDGTTDGDHVKMAGLHGLVENDKWATLGAALERLEVETVTGHEVFLVAPFSLVLNGSVGRRLDGRVGNARLLVRGQDMLLVIHGGRCTAICWVKREADWKRDTPWDRRSLMAVEISGSDSTLSRAMGSMPAAQPTGVVMHGPQQPSSTMKVLDILLRTTDRLVQRLTGCTRPSATVRAPNRLVSAWVAC